MECASVSFSGHALRRMFDRALRRDAVLSTIREGVVVAAYPDDRPYPSTLLLGYVAGQPVHVVVARDPEFGDCFVVTAYRPDLSVWAADFKTRREL